MRRRARLCFQTAPLCSIPATGRSVQRGAASILVLSITAKIHSIHFQTAFLYPGQKEFKGEVGFCSIEYSCENLISVFKLLLHMICVNVSVDASRIEYCVEYCKIKHY